MSETFTRSELRELVLERFKSLSKLSFQIERGISQLSAYFSGKGRHRSLEALILNALGIKNAVINIGPISPAEERRYREKLSKLAAKIGPEGADILIEELGKVKRLSAGTFK